MSKTITAIGIAIGEGAGNAGTKNGPKWLQESPFMPQQLQWKEIITSRGGGTDEAIMLSIRDSCHQLGESVAQTIQEQGFFCVIGGDHSCAMGTWSGVSDALDEDFGLIWVDAHCDAHTHDTTHTGNIHGMPVAALMGIGHEELTGIVHPIPKLKPENLVMIGIRDYEPEEHELLQSLGVKIYYNTDVAELGIDRVFAESLSYLREKTTHYGMSFDLDGLDPSAIPAVGTPVKDGVDAEACLQAVKQLAGDPQFIGYEIVEFNPDLDIDQMTEKYVGRLIEVLQPA